KPYSRETLARKIRHVLGNQHQRNQASARVAHVQSPAKAAKPSDGGAATAGSTILLVEDDALIRISTQDMLESLGHNVIGVGTGREAIAALRPEVEIL